MFDLDYGVVMFILGGLCCSALFWPTCAAQAKEKAKKDRREQRIKELYLYLTVAEFYRGIWLGQTNKTFHHLTSLQECIYHAQISKDHPIIKKAGQEAWDWVQSQLKAEGLL